MRALRITAILTCGAIFPAVAGFAAEVVRPPIAAGTFYPDTAEGLHAALTRFFDAAVVPYPDARLVAAISPHSAYGFCGEVAAHAFKALRPGQFTKVMILAPSHYASFEGCSVPYVSAFATPLGLVPVDGAAVERLCRSPLFTCKTIHAQVSAERIPIHEQEHAIEVLLPFLQERLGLFAVIPVLVGSLTDASGRFNINTCAAVAKTLQQVMDAQTLLVLSTDLTHYGNDFSFRPFRENVFENIEALDRQALDLIMNRDAEGFQKYIEENRNPICGVTAIHVFMQLLPPAARGIVLAHELSGRKTKNDRHSVSYAAVNFYVPNQSLGLTQGQPASTSTGNAAQAPRVFRLKGSASEDRAQYETGYFEEETWPDISSDWMPSQSGDADAAEMPILPPQKVHGEGFAVPGADTAPSPEPTIPSPLPAASPPVVAPQTPPQREAVP
ncbi:MAG TPA: AmmeMemoRadiSam system protein B, partial [Candidatus Hydrogenedentes bacterium]|nr:AmmeMemoRadiSam system protein B [Candidatus Hydrogenedentota bacterium]